MTLMEINALLPDGGSDKGRLDHSFKGESYLDVYETIMRPKQNDKITLLEIGVCSGISLALWSKYFPKGKICGMDIDHNCAKLNGTIDRVNVYIGSQSDHFDLYALVKHTGPLDFVIDDGSHFNEFTLKSFKCLWPSVKPGGWYIIEDLLCSYGPPNPDWPGMRYNARTDWNQTREPINTWLHGLIETMDKLQGDIRQIQIHPMQIFIQKV